MSSYLTIKPTAQGATLALTGYWTAETLPAIIRDVAARQLTGFKEIAIDGRALEDLDTSAAWFTLQMERQLTAAGVNVTRAGFDDGHTRLFKRLETLDPAGEPVKKTRPLLQALLITIGAQIENLRSNLARGISFFGEFTVNLLGILLSPRRLRVRSIVFQINEIGINAIPIIALMAFAIAFVMGYQGAFQLQKFDATAFTVDLIALSTLREMGVLLTAIMVAGRSGSSFAAQIGTMRLNEEVDALRTMGVSPFEALVMPRLIAIIIALPLLTIIADFMGLFGGYIFSASYMDYSFTQYYARMQEAVDLRQFWIGVSKAPFFALLIGVVGCMQGLRVRGSAEDVGRKTVTAVVQAIFLVIVADAIFSVIFTKMGI